MSDVDFEKDSKEFAKEVKLILSGNVNTDDENILNYLALKIERVHSEYVKRIVKQIKES